MQRPQADLGSFIRAWFLFLLRLYSAFVCYSVITSVFRRWRARLENDFGRVCDLRKIFVVCSTRECLGRMLTATERLILPMLSIWKRFGLVSDLRQILVMCKTCGRFLLEYSNWQRRFVLCSVLQRVWSRICSTLERVWLYVIFCCYIFCWAFLPFPPLPWPEGKSTLLPITPLRMGP